MKNRKIQQIYIIKKNCVQEMIVNHQGGIRIGFELNEGT